MEFQGWLKCLFHFLFPEGNVNVKLFYASFVDLVKVEQFAPDYFFLGFSKIKGCSQASRNCLDAEFRQRCTVNVML